MGRSNGAKGGEIMTPYSADNQLFSDLAHCVAQQTLYPTLFRCDPSALQFETANVADGGRSAILDGEMGIDKIIKVQVPLLHGPIVFTVQERFRRTKFDSYTDLTITEYNNTTAQLSELYKITAGIFVYGFFDDNAERFTKWVAADVNKMLYGIVTGGLRYQKKRNGRSNQDFIGIEVADLFDGGYLLAGINRHKWGIAP
jgi:hypothetical protein